MGSPNGERPANAYQINTVRGMQDVDPNQVSANSNIDMQQALEGIRGNLLFKLLGGFLNLPAALGSLLNDIGLAITAGPGAIIGGVLGAINQFVSGIKIQGDNTATTVAVEIPRLDNRIDAIDVGGAIPASRALFYSSGTWTKPLGPNGEKPVRHDFVAIGGGAGGSRRANTGYNRSDGGGGGGWSEYSYLDQEVPASLAVTVGSGGGGGASDGALGAPGGVSRAGSLLSAGGGQQRQKGYGSKTPEPYFGGLGSMTNENGIVLADPGSNGPFSNGGAGGSPSGSGNPGGDGQPPDPSTLLAPGSCGGGGSYKSGTGNGGRGGNGGFPGGGGGGGGGWNAFGVNGNGGNGANGLFAITSFFS